MTATQRTGPSELPHGPVAGHRTAQRLDIQGLRAVAVVLVVVYHLRPDLLPGGFVGVDVFFVISGFLIIGSLAGQVRRSGRIGLLDFYARRFRRLLPAATVVLLVTVVGTLIVLPQSLWPSILREVAASALDIQNWALAILSTDYTHATVGASPVQHFWSLSVEEQFYLFIPLVMLLSAALGRRRPLRGVFIGITVVTIASLVFSVVYTPISHTPAYFVTPTRVWELGLGGLAAIAVPRLRIGRAVRLMLGWVGLVAVAVSAVVFTTDMAFPGWIALLPTVGTLAVLLAGVLPQEEGAAGVETASLLGRQPLRYIGDISYSLYLWHWPLIVFAVDLTDGGELGRKRQLAVLVASFVLAALSKHFVEDPFRKRLKQRGSLVLGACLIAVSLVASVVPWQIAQQRLDSLAASITLDADHPGALVLDPTGQAKAPSGVALQPDPTVAGRDFPFAGKADCVPFDYAHHNVADASCAYGDAQAPNTIVLIGDSHAAMFSTALADYVQRNPLYRLKVMMRNGCPFSATPPSEAGVALTDCSDQDKGELAAILAAKPALVVTTAMSQESYKQDLNWTWRSPQAMVDGYRGVLKPLSDAGIPVAVIHDVPRPLTSVPECVQRNPQQFSRCDTPLDRAFPPADTLVQAATGLPGAKVVDLTKWLCTGAVCPGVIGNVIVYRDNHLTNTYVHTLSKPLADALGLH
ncbi:acyltransferase family protein [Kutzneria chonburiensis]|uniref:Acyltransferase family protein n=1 Tax=Kutzneria chonburiensis TaxID=1483604 RepID=A0ABV6MQC8_9PSEU|nr:acyltransferase family protein [Kutzneria chonburiensis]